MGMRGVISDPDMWRSKMESFKPQSAEPQSEVEYPIEHSFCSKAFFKIRSQDNNVSLYSIRGVDNSRDYNHNSPVSCVI